MRVRHPLGKRERRLERAMGKYPLRAARKEKAVGKKPTWVKPDLASPTVDAERLCGGRPRQ